MDDTTITQLEYRADPRGAFELAVSKGSVTIIGPNGTPVARLSVPKDRRVVVDEDIGCIYVVLVESELPTSVGKAFLSLAGARSHVAELGFGYIRCLEVHP
jgi:hypothetical protein